jgi:hypothetical protein
MTAGQWGVACVWVIGYLIGMLLLLNIVCKAMAKRAGRKLEEYRQSLRPIQYRNDRLTN